MYTLGTNQFSHWPPSASTWTPEWVGVGVWFRAVGPNDLSVLVTRTQPQGSGVEDEPWSAWHLAWHTARRHVRRTAFTKPFWFVVMFFIFSSKNTLWSRTTIKLTFNRSAWMSVTPTRPSYIKVYMKHGSPVAETALFNVIFLSKHINKARLQGWQN